ncbi:hypothetical protein [Ferrimonas aestuarii]|uniref:Uncharacterized protein n=1 Tax=Ferrimonas aestuarii TaxID=2569539 RepID=A0A4V5NWR7_9GAMM|nr:hypothetical protein [Ferrimonas aestuarii]TKB57562.1 hypothetical protein FCL42_04625 [Ferrimonas aestuarii]
MLHINRSKSQPAVIEQCETWRCLQLSWRHWLKSGSRVLVLGSGQHLGVGLAEMGHEVDMLSWPISEIEWAQLSRSAPYELVLMPQPFDKANELTKSMACLAELMVTQGLLVQVCTDAPCCDVVAQIVSGIKAGWKLKARYEEGHLCALVWAQNRPPHHA